MTEPAMDPIIGTVGSVALAPGGVPLCVDFAPPPESGDVRGLFNPDGLKWNGAPVTLGELCARLVETRDLTVTVTLYPDPQRYGVSTRTEFTTGPKEPL